MKLADVAYWPISTDASDVAEVGSWGTAEVLERHREAWRQVARRSRDAALAGMKLARSHTGHERRCRF
jgi:hypothetical protein